MKIHILVVALSLTQAAYISRMTTVNRQRVPIAFRPGVNLQRYWNQQLVAPAASQRVPYVVYRNSPHRFAVKHYTPTHRNVHQGSWKTTARLPAASSTTAFDFLRAASAPPVSNNGGAIHTIPAPNLSLSEKPIIVVDASETVSNGNTVSQPPKPIYEVTEQYPEPEYHMAKIETPIGFSKTKTSSNAPELQTLIREAAALQVASQYGISPISAPQNGHVIHQHIPVQPFNGIPTQQDLINSGAEGIVIPPNALYQPDPMFLQKLQSQIIQSFPSVEFIPYSAELPPANPQIEIKPQLILLENDEIKQEPSSFVPMYQKNLVQRDTQESSAVTLIPQAIVVFNATDKSNLMSASNTTGDLIAEASQPITTTIKYIADPNRDRLNTTPIFYAQIGQSIGDVIAKGFYSAINDVRAAAALAQIEKLPESNRIADTAENITTTTVNPNLEPYFVKTKEEGKDNKTVSELKSLLGMPFSKTSDSVNVAYTLLRSDTKEPKMTQEGTVYAGQIVEASGSHKTCRCT
uniref:Cuticle protein n=1 Tax=Bombyx mori TaxID=7091 RepID=A0A8R2QZZ6_BOMMO|nr:uncharacterized protein LOC105842326 [Bombyx mori]